MNRRGFLGGIFKAAAAIALAPTIDLLSEERTVCGGGLLAQIEASGNKATYSELNISLLEEILGSMPKHQGGEVILHVTENGLKEFNKMMRRQAKEMKLI